MFRNQSPGAHSADRSDQAGPPRGHHPRELARERAVCGVDARRTRAVLRRHRVHLALHQVLRLAQVHDPQPCGGALRPTDFQIRQVYLRDEALKKSAVVHFDSVKNIFLRSGFI